MYQVLTNLPIQVIDIHMLPATGRITFMFWLTNSAWTSKIIHIETVELCLSGCSPEWLHCSCRHEQSEGVRSEWGFAVQTKWRRCSWISLEPKRVLLAFETAFSDDISSHILPLQHHNPALSFHPDHDMPVVRFLSRLIMALTWMTCQELGYTKDLWSRSAECRK